LGEQPGEFELGSVAVHGGTSRESTRKGRRLRDMSEEGHVMRNKVLVGVTAVLLAIPAISIAADRFTDVPSSHTFHDDISWLADRGITRGCNPPANDEYCPDDSVTRGQMAAFMRRFANTSQPRLVGGEGAGGTLSENNWATLVSMTVDVPADGGALLLNGSTILSISDDDDLGGGGLLQVTLDQECTDTSDGAFAIWETISIGGDSPTAVGSFPVSQGSHVVRLCAFVAVQNEPTQAQEPRVSALWASAGQVSTLGAESLDTSLSKSDLLERIRAMVSNAGE
jgi:hypothetical protein